MRRLLIEVAASLLCAAIMNVIVTAMGAPSWAAFTVFVFTYWTVIRKPDR